MKLTHENYFSPEVMMHYMSTTQFKAFEECEARAYAELRGLYTPDRAAYKEGHFFEACITGNENKFLSGNSDMLSGRGASKGELKSNYKRVAGSMEAFKRQPLFSDIVNRCRQQVIVTGEIAGLPFKGCIDFFDPASKCGYDTKCMKDFKKVYSSVEKMRINWYFAYAYHYQAAIYRELIRQTYGNAGQQHIMGVTKEEYPDVAALCFADEILDNALGIINEFAPRYGKIKKGLIPPESCGVCNYCRQNKVIDDFEVIYDFE